MIDDLLNPHSGSGGPTRGSQAWRRLAAGTLALGIIAATAGQVQATSIESGVAARVIGTAAESSLVETLATDEPGPVGAQHLEVPAPSPGADAPHAVDLGDSFDGVSGQGAVRGDVNGLATSLVVPAQSLAPGLEPMVDYGTSHATSISVTEVLRSVVTLQGEPEPAGPASAASAKRTSGTDVPLGGLRDLVLELLEEHISPLGTEDGKTVFSVLGAGLFTLEVARNGSSIRLSELGSGKSVLLGTGSDEGRANAQAHRTGPEDDTRPGDATTGHVMRSGSEGLGQEGPLPGLISAIADALASIPRFIIDIASSPIMLVLLLPLALIWFLIDTLRQRMTGEPVAAPETDRGTQDAVTTGRHRKRRRRGKRVRWRAIFAEIRTSLGFPQAELIREGTPEVRRTRRRRRRVIVR